MKRLTKQIVQITDSTINLQPKEALENINKLFVGSSIDITKLTNIIKTALNRLEEYKNIEKRIGMPIKEVFKDNVNKSEGLGLCIVENLCKRITDYRTQLKSALNRLEELEKVLKIIKEKEVNVFIFLHSGDLETYNDMVEDNRKLTETEFNLLKEYLK